MSGSDPSDPTGGMPSQESGVTSDSVLPSLMQVYNTMIQSKTPEGGVLRGATSNATGRPGVDAFKTGPADGVRQTMDDHHGGPANVEEWNAYTAAMAAGASQMSLPSIPPPYPTPADVNPPTTKSNNATADAVASSSAETRSLRKRSNASSSPTEDTSLPGSVSSSGRRPTKARRKAKDTDPRWSKRFTWPEDLHRDFVAAVFDVGLKHSSPSTILESMPKHEQITSERVKSHLQKYRIHRIKSKKEFMSSYDEGLKKIREGTLGSLSAGELASFLTHNSMNENETADSAGESEHNLPRPATVENEDQNPIKGKKDTENPSQEILTLPRLTEIEKQSPIGASMGYLMGLFFSLKQQLMAQRSAATQSTQSTQKSKNAKSSATSSAATASGMDPSSFGAPVPIASSPAISAAGPSVAGVPPPTSSNNAAQATTVVSNPSTRSNLEENNMMKREMQNQMAFQNKMRGLKEQELNKFRNAEAEKERASHAMTHTTTAATAPSSGTSGHSVHTMTSFLAAAEKAAADAAHQQGAGELAADGTDRGRTTRGLSFGGAEDFWNTDVMDDQLFEFLMSE